MAKLGGMFLTCALGPVSYAGSCIMASRVTEGLNELQPSSLLGGVQRGVEQLGKRVGLSSRDVETVLPQNEMRGLLERLAVSHKNASDAWGFYSSNHGGLLQGVADLTIDGRPPDAALCLQRLAKKVSRDKAFSLPIKALADDIAAWQDMVHQCRVAIDDGRALAEAYRRRRMRTYAIGIAAGVVVSVLAITWLRYHAARGRVADVLAADDACLVDKIDASDLDKASSDQLASLERKKTACKLQHELLVGLEATMQRVREDIDKAAKVEAEHVAKCEALASHVEAGALDDDDRALAGPSAELLDRVMKLHLQGADFGPTDPPLPCEGTSAAARLHASYAAAIYRSPYWVRVDDPSPSTQAEIAKHKNELRPWPRRAIGVRAETTAKRAIVAGDPELVAKSVRLCELADAIDAPVGAGCKSIHGFEKK